MSLDLDHIYRKYGPLVLRRCRALLKNEEQAVDAMQDVFVELLRRQDHLEISAYSTFMYRSATNVCLNRIRSQRRHPADADTDLLQRIAYAPDDEPQTLARLWLANLFSHEPPSTRTMAVMHLLDGFTLEEVAEATGLSISGVRKRLRTLRDHVQELEGSPA